MNTRNLIAAAALATLGAAASAAPVDAYVANTAQSHAYSGEAFGTVEAPRASAQAREDVIAQFQGTTTEPAPGEAYGYVTIEQNQALTQAATVTDVTVAAADADWAVSEGVPSAQTLAANDPVAQAIDYGDYAYTSTQFRVNDAYALTTTEPVPDEIIVLVTPSDETVTLLPGEALLVVPMDDGVVDGE